jgi:hypothetical protein
MTFVDAWICKACWKPNRPQDPACYRCKTPREADDAEVEARRAAAAARAEQPEAVPDIVVALPVVIFRGYSRAWLRSGFFVLALLFLEVFAGVTDVGYLILTGGLGIGLIAFGFAAGEVSDAMRNREVWAFVLGVGLSIVAVVGTVMAFDIFAPGLVNPAGIRIGSLVVFGGAGVAAIAGLVMMFTRRERAA